MNDDNEQFVIDVFKRYRSSSLRSYQTYVAVNAFEGSTVSRGGKSPVADLYRAYQASRDPYRSRVFSNVMREVSTHLESRKSDAVAATQGSGTTTEKRSSWISWLAPLMDRLQAPGTPRFAFAAALLLAVAMVPLLWQDHRRAPVLADAGPWIEAHSAAIAGTIQPLSDPTFAFSRSRNPSQSAFRFGVLSVDLPVLARTQAIQALRALAGEFDGFGELHTAGSLRKSYQSFQTILKNPTQNDLVEGSQRLIFELDKFYSDRKLRDAYELGKYVELLLLVSQLADADRKPPLTDLLRQTKATVGLAKKHFAELPGVPAIIDSFMPMSITSESVSGTRKLRNNLQQLKAAIM